MATTFCEIFRHFAIIYNISNAHGGHCLEGCLADPFQHGHGHGLDHVGDVEGVHVLGDEAVSTGDRISTKMSMVKKLEAYSETKCLTNQEKYVFSLLQFYVVFLEKLATVLIFNRKFQ